MLICSLNADENKQVERITKEYIPFYSSETWNFNLCEGVESANECVYNQSNLEFTCLDLTMEGAISFAERLRKKFPQMVLLIVADSSISPMSYLKPSIMAASLLLRPYSEEQLKQAVRELFQYALNTGGKEDNFEECFIIELKDERIRVAYCNITFFESRDKKVFLSTGVKEYAFYGTLDTLEKELPKNFVRCHRGYILNVSRIKQLKLTENVVILDDGSLIPLSRKYRNVVREAM